MSLVTDDWRYRMLTPPKGNVDYVPVNHGRAAREPATWDPAKDEAAGEACRAYGAGGVMRLPARLHITWEDDNTMQHGHRRGHADAPVLLRVALPPCPARRGRRGRALGGALDDARRPGRRGRGPAPELASSWSTTTRLRPGYVRKNGVPYGANADAHRVLRASGRRAGQEYLAVTTMVDDPQYLAQPYIKTYEFKKQRDATGWNPTPCSAK